MTTLESLAPIWRVMEPAEWPAPPEQFSYSQFHELEQCPRRWALSRAMYPDVWGRGGYPPKVFPGTLVGSIVHNALEEIVPALARAGCTSMHDPRVVDVLRELGGIREVLNRQLHRVVQSVAENPRLGVKPEEWVHDLERHIPDMRVRVQSFLSRIELHPSLAAVSERTWAAGMGDRRPLGFGSHPEVDLFVAHLRWMGRADLINLSAHSCEILDFKTGEKKEEHLFQLRVYALLWARDVVVNPTGRLADQLTVSYSDRSVTFPAPSAMELDELEEELIMRATAAVKDAETVPPPARPDAMYCRLCSVRQMCGEYWEAMPLNSCEVADPPLYDLQIRYSQKYGLRTWRALVEHSPLLAPGTKILIRLPSERHPAYTVLETGRRCRILGARILANGEENIPTALLSASSEAFAME